MGSPVQIPGLPSAAVANDADFTLLRQGLTDYKCSVALLRNINVQNLTYLPGTVALNDQILVSRIVAGNPTNFKVSFSSIGFVAGTKMWFYMSAAQIVASLPGWSLVPGTGDALLAVQGGFDYTNPGTQQGTWQQPNIKLNLNNIPSHTHTINEYTDSVGGLSKSFVMGANVNVGNQALGTSINFAGGDTTQPNNPTVPIFPSPFWRPMASVGQILTKERLMFEVIHFFLHK